MPYQYNKHLTQYSRELRNDMTPEEKHLWYDFLKKLPVTVNRQKIIGDYIVDFYIHSASIAIEIDGIQHKARANAEKDDIRDKALNSLGISVLRYPNYVIKDNFNYVCEDILNHLALTWNDVKK